MHNLAAKRTAKLREQMAKHGIDLYVVPTADYHGSEYVGEHFKAREYITGFTGSAGTAVITMEEAGLWTDGRYFIQAKEQLQGSGVTLQRMEEEGVPSVKEYIESKLKPGGCLGFDGRTVCAKAGEEYETLAAAKQAKLDTTKDLAGQIWENRPPLSKEPFFVLEEAYAGCTVAKKLSMVRAKMEEKGADLHILSSLYDIAWLLNVRGGDISHVPVVLSYLVLSKKECVWFVQEDIITDAQKEFLSENQITTMPYDAVYAYVAAASAKAVLYDEHSVNYMLLQSIPKQTKRIAGQNPTELLKAVKNPTELRNTVTAHIKDGLAFTKFMYWLKTNIGKIPMTERSASDYLEQLRRAQENFLDLSFDTICAYGANAAKMHYAATPESDATLKPEGFLLVDSGGHYLEGTTDITRTMALGPVTEEMRRNFTAVLRANLNLADAKFLYGCKGIQLDILAREPLWELCLDYKCGTGHGVGHILNVHEGPNAFRWRLREGEESKDNGVLEEGMVTTDEPGVYIEGAYGIRIENELVCRRAQKNEYGQFMRFETITYAPVDLDAVDERYLSPCEKERLNAYHRKVYETLSPHLPDAEREWLKEYTREI